MLTISGATLTDTANYTLVVTNIYGAVTSSVANLTVIIPSSAYEAGVAALSPVAYYVLNETGDPATNNTVAYDYANGFNGVYGTAVKNGNSLYNIQGPQSSTGFPGFVSGNLAAQFTNSATAVVNLPAWNLNTNGWTGTTLTAWIDPANSSASFEPNGAGIVMTRAAGNVCGINYINQTNAGNRVIGYSWNNDAPATWQWNSGLFAPSNQWSLVVLTVTPTNAIMYVISTNSISSATNVLAHVPMVFNGATMIGQGQVANGGSAFIGAIDEVAAFGQALTLNQVITLFTNAAGAGTIPTSLTVLSSANPAGYQSSLTFTATNLPADATNNVIFQVNGVAFSTNAVANGGATSLAISSLPRGTTNIIIATFTGDNNYLSSMGTLTQTVTNHPPVASNISLGALSGV